MTSNFFKQLGLPDTPPNLQDEPSIEHSLSIPMYDEEDQKILMHKDAHFGSSFSVMREYYENEDHLGIQEDISLKRLEQLEAIQDKEQANLSDLLLSSQDKALVCQSKITYQKLAEICEASSCDSNNPSYLIANLILSEDPDEFALLKEGDSLKLIENKDLIELIENQEFWNPIFPGYGLAPLRAIEVLAKKQQPSSIPVIFNSLKKVDFFNEAPILEALKSYQEEAKQFLLKRLQSEPFSEDNLQAAHCLQSFADAEISSICFDLLESKKVNLDSQLAQYLVLSLEKLPKQRLADLRHFSEKPDLPTSLKEEINFLLHHYQA